MGSVNQARKGASRILFSELGQAVSSTCGAALMSCFVYLAPCSAGQPIADAIAVVEKADAAGNACDWAALDPLLADNLKSSVSIKDPSSGQYHVVASSKSDMRSSADQCRRGDYSTVSDRVIQLAEVKPDGRVDLSGLITQTDTYSKIAKVMRASGNFITSVLCDDTKCRIVVDVTMFHNVVDKPAPTAR